MALHLFSILSSKRENGGDAEESNQFSPLDRLTLLKSETLSFAPIMSQLEATPNIAIISIFRFIPDSKSHPVLEEVNGILISLYLLKDSIVIASNTHLFWRPEFDSLRALQAHRLRSRVEELRNEFRNEKVTLIMCGGKSDVGGIILFFKTLLSNPFSSADWNSDPKSLTYLLMTGQEIEKSLWETTIKTHSEQVHPLPRESEAFATRLFTQVKEDFEDKFVPLTSAYSFLKSPRDPCAVGEPPYTSVNSYIDTLDYIFIANCEVTDGCSVVVKADSKTPFVSKLLMLPPEEIVLGQTALPNEIYSSDHLALWVELEL